MDLKPLIGWLSKIADELDEVRQGALDANRLRAEMRLQATSIRQAIAEYLSPEKEQPCPGRTSTSE
jgi:hypothetical protein